MNLAFLAFFDRCLRLAPATVVSPRAEAAVARGGFRNRDLRHEPVRDDEKVMLRWARDPETGKAGGRWAGGTPEGTDTGADLADHRGRRANRYRSRFVWPDRRSA